MQRHHADKGFRFAHRFFPWGFRIVVRVARSLGWVAELSGIRAVYMIDVR